MKQLGAVLLLAGVAFGAAVPPVATEKDLGNEVRQTLTKLPYYGVFDHLEYSIDGEGVVTLSGATRTYVVRNSAVSAVKHLDGVSRVEDKIEVLPLSRFDDDIRVRAFNAIFRYPALSRYAINPMFPIRIIVNRGDVTLEGVVNNEFDRTLIYNRIQALPGIFSVTNELRLDSDAVRSES